MQCLTNMVQNLHWRAKMYINYTYKEGCRWSSYMLMLFQHIIMFCILQSPIRSWRAWCFCWLACTCTIHSFMVECTLHSLLATNFKNSLFGRAEHSLWRSTQLLTSLNHLRWFDNMDTNNCSCTWLRKEEVLKRKVSLRSFLEDYMSNLQWQNCLRQTEKMRQIQ